VVEQVQPLITVILEGPLLVLVLVVVHQDGQVEVVVMHIGLEAEAVAE
jgi:hypothetical protein